MTDTAQDYIPNGMPDDLAFIACKVAEWPSDEVTQVRLDMDGEICFTFRTGPGDFDVGGESRFDFYPEDRKPPGVRHRFFEPAPGRLAVGVEYTREEWAAARVVCVEEHPHLCQNLTQHT